jgi:hypothetical protein
MGLECEGKRWEYNIINIVSNETRTKACGAPLFFMCVRNRSGQQGIKATTIRVTSDSKSINYYLTFRGPCIVMYS